MATPAEREFLGLAGTYLSARWCVMGHELEGHRNNLEFDLLGMVDYQYAMRDFARKWRANPQHTERYVPTL